MATTDGVPIRLSPALARRARELAALLDRSLTEQVEHWARLGQIVEAAISSDAVAQLKARSYDANVPALLEVADSPAGKAKAVALIARRNETLHGADDAGRLYQVAGRKTKTRRRR